MKKRLLLSILISGFGGLVAQVLLLREFLIVFLGNELSLGIILSNWLILEALGSYLSGRLFGQNKRKPELFVLCLLIFSLSFPLSLYFLRTLKAALGITPGEALGLWTMFYSSFLLLFPVSFSHGALFSLGCGIYSENKKNISPVSSAGRVYVLETLGTALGGVVFTYFLIPFFHSFKICLGISLVHLVVAVVLLWGWAVKDLVSKTLRLLSLFLLTLVFFILVNYSNHIHRASVSQQWQDQDLVYYQNSLYGNIAVARNQEQFTFFSNGVPVFSHPTPDIARVEELAHLALLSHRKPQTCLVIGAGSGGLIEEMLKHKTITKIDYAELDPLLIQVAKRSPFSSAAQELSDRRVHIRSVDGRLFLRQTQDKYDLIFVGLDLPLDLQSNRLFTLDFFKQAKQKLNHRGILVITLPGSLTYLSQELKQLNFSIISSLVKVYPYLKVIPGDSTNIYLASGGSYLEDLDSSLLYQRLKDRNIQTRLLSQDHFEYKLDLRRVSWFKDSLKGTSSRINRDFLPSGLFYALSFFNSSFYPRGVAFFRHLFSLDLVKVLGGLGLFTCLFILLGLRLRRLYNLSIPFSIATTGFSSMIFNLAMILSFQIIYGYVFYWIGILLSVFMLGVVSGGLVFTLALERIKIPFKAYMVIEAAVIVFSFICPFIVLGLHSSLSSPGIYFITKTVFLFLCFVAGFLTAAEFPLGNKLYLSLQDFNLGRTAGSLYSADLLGGWLGGILGGVILFPVLGLMSTFFVLVILKIISSLILLISRRKGVIS
jgi:spermidine synthase